MFVIGCAIEVHKTLGGPGLLESVYEECLVWELNKKGIEVERQVSLPIIYKTHKIHTSFRIDLIIEKKVIVECKATTQYNKIFESQLLTYLRLSGLKVGLYSTVLSLSFSIITEMYLIPYSKRK